MTVALALGSEITHTGMRFAPDRNEEERAGAVVNILRGNAGEASMMARCAGKTRQHKIEPEDLRSVTRATAAATGKARHFAAADGPTALTPPSNQIGRLRFLILRTSCVRAPAAPRPRRKFVSCLQCTPQWCIHPSFIDTGDRAVAETAELKHERVHLRLDARSKRKLERAAAYEETTVSRFVLSNAVAAAERIIEARERIVLPATDWDAFHEALLNPPAPNAALRRAARRYRERIGG